MQSALAPTPVPTVLRWVRPPQQARTRESLARLLDAAEALVAERGFEDASIAEIARRADTSVGAFYRRFRDKDGLLHALHERFCEEARATADDALDPGRWAGAPIAEVVAQFTAFLVQIFREREGFLRALIVRGVTDGLVRRRTEDLFAHLAERMARLLDRRRAEYTHPDGALAAAFGLRVILGALDHLVLTRPTAFTLTDAQLGDELARVFLSYLGVAAPAAPPHKTSPPKRRRP